MTISKRVIKHKSGDKEKRGEQVSMSPFMISRTVCQLVASMPSEGLDAKEKRREKNASDRQTDCLHDESR